MNTYNYLVAICFATVFLHHIALSASNDDGLMRNNSLNTLSIIKSNRVENKSPLLATTRKQIKATCGYPGSPQNGRVLHLLERYEEGMVVTYECNTDYYLLGPMTRTCLPNGTWSNRMPICDQSIKNLGLTSASEALNNYPSQLAIDENSRTCFFSNRRKPRWWRVELPKSSLNNQSIISVALTLPPINAELFFSIYVIEMENSEQMETIDVEHRDNIDNYSVDNKTDLENVSKISNSNKYYKCATFRGVFSSKTIFVQCATNGRTGLKGNYLHIEDDYPQLEYFGLCEVDLFVERSKYECGKVEVPAYGYVIDNPVTIDGIRSVEYRCHDGHQIVGYSKRRCDTKTGQWVDQEPYCKRITCPDPILIQNGYYRIYGDYYDWSILGTRTVYECRPGYVFTETTTNDTRVCDRNGQWTGEIPQCEPIDCGHPESLLVNSEEFFLSGAQFRLLNESTKFSSIAELICSSQDIARGNLSRASVFFRCREDGIWIEISAHHMAIDTIGGKSFPVNNTSNNNSCVKQRHNGFLYYYTYGTKNFLRKNFYIRETSINILHLLAAVVIAAFLSIIIIIVLLFKRKIVEWPANIHCCPQVCTIKSNKSIGQLAAKFIIWIFLSLKGFYLSSISICIPKMNANSGNNPDQKGSTKSMTYIITSNSDIESDRSSSLPNSDNSESNELSNKANAKDNFNTALATFYEEITNAAKQMFSEETDRKLLRAARIAAELDAIKNQSDPTDYINNTNKRNYQWIYSTSPRFATSTSLPPSLHEYQQIPSESQLYAKVDLIRKHRYRKEKEITSVYQVPKTPLKTMPAIDASAIQYQSIIDRNNSYYPEYYNNYRLRKAVSTPDTFFAVVGSSVSGDHDQYGAIFQNKTLRMLQSNASKRSKNAYNHNQAAQVVSNHNSPPIIHELTNKNPIKTLL